MIEHDDFYDIFGDEISMVRIDCFWFSMGHDLVLIWFVFLWSIKSNILVQLFSYFFYCLVWVINVRSGWFVWELIFKFLDYRNQTYFLKKSHNTSIAVFTHNFVSMLVIAVKDIGITLIININIFRYKYKIIISYEDNIMIFTLL